MVTSIHLCFFLWCSFFLLSWYIFLHCILPVILGTSIDIWMRWKKPNYIKYQIKQFFTSSKNSNCTSIAICFYELNDHHARHWLCKVHCLNKEIICTGICCLYSPFVIVYRPTVRLCRDDLSWKKKLFFHWNLHKTFIKMDASSTNSNTLFWEFLLGFHANTIKSYVHL